MTTLGVGGPALFFAEARTLDEVAEALDWAAARGLPLFVLGGGSNLLVADRGFDGLVLRLRLEVLEEHEGGEGERLVDAGAGCEWDAFVARAVDRGLAGVECLSGIPGLTGATPIQNVGAYGQEVSQVIRTVQVMDRSTRGVFDLDASACRFGYRDSVFKREARGRYVVLAVRFALVPGGAPTLVYPELESAVHRLCGAAPTLAGVREVVLGLRRQKSMVLDHEDPNRQSAGSFFTNPLVEPSVAERVSALAAARGVLAAAETVPVFDAPGGLVKLSAGWLIERSGFAKGTGERNVGLSTRHALAIVNRGGASASEIAAFAARIREGVEEAFQVQLTPEPEWLGFTDDELRRWRGTV